MVTNLNFNNEYVYFDTIFIYAGNTFLNSIVNHCKPRRPKGTSGERKVSASCTAQAIKARLDGIITINSPPLKIISVAQYLKL